MHRTTNGVEELFDPLTPSFAREPISILDRMRSQTPVYEHQGTLRRVVSLFRYSDCETVLKDYETWSSNRGEEVRKAGLGDAMILLFDDPPLHTERRGVVRKDFMPAGLARLQPTIEATVDRLLAQSCGREIEFVAEVAAPLTISVVGSMLGVRVEDMPMIRGWTEKLARIDGLSNFLKEPDTWMEASVSGVLSDMSAYFTERFDEADENAPDLLGVLKRSKLTRSEAISLAKFILHAGNETTTNLISNLVELLVTNPHEFDKVRADPSLIGGAIDETLRLRGSFRETERVATRTVLLHDVEFNKGDTVVTWLASANRDPEVFERPHQFDITRSPNRHLSFARGIHTCLGNMLAKAEVSCFLNAIIRDNVKIKLGEGHSVRRVENPLMNGIAAMRVGMTN